MKKRIMFLVLVVVMVLGVGFVSAQSNLPGSGWQSGHQIQNVGDADATVQFTAYDLAGADYDCGSEVAVPDGSVNVKIDTCVADGFAGSAVVSSDQPMAAIINVNNKGTGNAAGQYTGTDGADVATTISFPLMKNDFHGRTTTFYIQNSSDSLNDLTATFTVKGESGTYEKIYSDVPANSMVIIIPEDASVADGVVGGLSVTGTSALAGTVLEHETTAAIAENLQASRAFSPNDYDTQLYCPLVRYNHTSKDQTTGVQVQNTDVTTQTITITYGNGITNTADVAAGASHTFPTKNDLAEGVKQSATLTSAGPIVAVVNDKGLSTSDPQRVTTYACFAGAGATTSVSLPLVKERLGVNQTGVQVQNVGGSSITITVTYNNSGGTVVVQNATPLVAGESFTFNNIYNYNPALITVVSGDPATLEGTNNGVAITATGPIVAIANESTVSGTTIQDTKNYEGFNQ